MSATRFFEGIFWLIVLVALAVWGADQAFGQGTIRYSTVAWDRHISLWGRCESGYRYVIKDRQSRAIKVDGMYNPIDGAEAYVIKGRHGQVFVQGSDCAWHTVGKQFRVRHRRHRTPYSRALHDLYYRKPVVQVPDTTGIYVYLGGHWVRDGRLADVPGRITSFDDRRPVNSNPLP